MKKGAVLLLTLLCGMTVCADEFREFTSADGITIQARIQHYDAGKGVVTLERDNRKTAKVPLTALSEEDQTYIKEWGKLEGFMSDRLLKISCDDNELEDWKEEVWEDVRYTSGVVERELTNTIDFEKIAYDITLQNAGKANLENLCLEYIIFYEQSKEAMDNPVPEQLQLSGKIEIETVAPGKKITVTTDPIVLQQDNIIALNLVSGESRVGGKGRLHGMRGRLFMKTDDGKEVMRELVCPDSLSDEDFPWKD